MLIVHGQLAHDMGLNLSIIFQETKKQFRILLEEKSYIIGKLDIISQWCNLVLKDKKFDNLKVDRIKLQRIIKQAKILRSKL